MAKKTRKLFQVAKELKLATATLTSELEELGHKVTKAQMTPISEKMYWELLQKFAPDRWAGMQEELAHSEAEEQEQQSKAVRQEELRKILETDDDEIKTAPSVRHLEPGDITIIAEEEPGASPGRETARADGAADEAGTAESETEAYRKVKLVSPTGTMVRGAVSNEDILTFTPPPPTQKAPKPVAPTPPPGQTETREDDEIGKKRRRKRRRKSRRGKESAPSKATTGGWMSTGDSGGRRRRRREKKKKPDAAEVQASIKQTFAAMEETGRRKKRRRITPDVGVIDEDSNLIKITEYVSTQELALLIDIPVIDLIKECLMLGLRVTINQRLEHVTIQLLAEEHGYHVEFIDEVPEEEMLEENEEDEEVEGEQEPRPPVVTVMGHVDHGKTSLLDNIRKSHIAEGEVGGITQHIGAYEIEHKGNSITFLDTPGHEAFTAMRARGAQVTDIVVLVVAADDQVMPQTIEAIDHANAAGVPMVVAINKIDKTGSNPEKVRQQLGDRNVLVEEWGGEVQSAEVSAKTGHGLDDLLDKILIAAEMLDLKAVRDTVSRGVIIESRLDKGRGTVCTILAQKGTLKIGDVFVAGPHFGRVRAMFDESGKKRTEAIPGQPVQITGFESAPHVGDHLIVYSEEREAKELSIKRQQQLREQEMRLREGIGRVKDGDLLQAIDGDRSELRLVIKGDVDGSVEAIADSLMRLSSDEVGVSIIHRSVGPINESDILLAGASGAMVIGFNVHPSLKAREMAAREEVPFEIFRVIYELIENVKDMLKGMYRIETRQEIVGTAEVRDLFKISRIGVIAGCYVTDGKLAKSNKLRLLRDGTEVYTGEIESLKRFKDDTREVAQGYECGIKIANYNDIKVGDVLEALEEVEVDRNIVVGEM